MFASGCPPAMARKSSGISQPVKMTGRSRRKAGRSASPGALSRGQALTHVRRLVSKYSAMPSHSTPSKSMARMSGMAMASGAPFDGHVEQEGPARGEGLVEGGAQLVRRSDPGTLHSHAACEVDEAQVRRD